MRQEEIAHFDYTKMFVTQANYYIPGTGATSEQNTYSLPMFSLSLQCYGENKCQGGGSTG